LITSGETSRGPHSSFVAALINAAVMAAEDKLGRDTVVLDLRELVDSFDALVVASGRNDRQVRAIAEEVERLVEIASTSSPFVSKVSPGPNGSPSITVTSSCTSLMRPRASTTTSSTSGTPRRPSPAAIA